jgi:hypothetical protein
MCFKDYGMDRGPAQGYTKFENHKNKYDQEYDKDMTIGARI